MRQMGITDKKIFFQIFNRHNSPENIRSAAYYYLFTYEIGEIDREVVLALASEDDKIKKAGMLLWLFIEIDNPKISPILRIKKLIDLFEEKKYMTDDEFVCYVRQQIHIKGE